MKVTLIEDFVCYPDGYTRRELKEGEVVEDLPLEISEGLVAKKKAKPFETRSKKPAKPKKETKEL